jgi:hypothetical protein
MFMFLLIFCPCCIKMNVKMDKVMDINVDTYGNGDGHG